MDDRYECSYNNALLASDFSTDSADKVTTLLEEKDNDLYYMDDFRDTMYNYVWLSDNETLAVGSDSGEEKTGRMSNVNHTEKDTLAESQSDGIDRPENVKDRLAELKETQENGENKIHISVKSTCFLCGSGKENCTCSDGQVENKEKDIINVVENIQPKSFDREKGLLRNACIGMDRSKTSKDEIREFKYMKYDQSCCEKLTDKSYPGNEHCTCDSKVLGHSGQNTIGGIGKCESCICKKTLTGVLNDIEENELLLKNTVDHEKSKRTSNDVCYQRNNFKGGKSDNGQCKNIEQKRSLKTPMETSARKVEISKSVDNIIISELCPSFKSALSKQKRTEVLTKMSRNKKNCIFGEVFEPRKQVNKIHKGMKSRTFPVKTRRLSESFWCKKEDTLFGSSSQIYDDRSDFRIAGKENIPDHDEKTRSSEQNLSEPKTSDLIDLNAANKKFSPMLKTETKSKSSGKMNKIQTATVRSVRRKHLKGVQRESKFIKNSWLRCMPTPTTKKLLAGKIKMEIPSVSETSNDKQLQTSDLEQSSSDIDEMSNLPKDKVEDVKLSNTKEKYSVSSSSGMRKENNTSSKNNRKEKVSKTQMFTNKQPKLGYNVNYENKNVKCSTMELRTKNLRKLASRLYATDENTFENFDLGVHTKNNKKHEIVGNTDSKYQPRKSSCKRKKNALRFRRTYLKRKGKEVKVFRTVKGIERVAFRYPCNFCGDLFSKGYVWKHERIHVRSGCKKINQRYQQKIDTDRDSPTSEIVSDGNCLPTTRRSALTCCPTEQVHTTEKRRGSLVCSVLPAFYKKVANMHSPKVSGSATNNQSTVVKSIASKTHSRIADSFSSEVEKGQEIHSVCGRKAVKKNTIRSFSSIPGQSCSSDICKATKKRSYLATKAEKKKRIYSNIKEGFPRKCESGAQMYSGKYSCTMCKYSSKNECYLTRHLAMHACCSQTVTCKCGIAFRNRLTLKQWHKRNNVQHEMGDAIEAPHCTSKRSARKFQRLGNKDKNMMVKSNSNVQRTLKHGMKKSCSKRQKCGECNYKFSNLSNWMKHKLLHDSNTGSTCIECSITMKSRCSLAYWHYRHGIHHIRRKKRSSKCTVKEQQKHRKHEPMTGEAYKQNPEVSETAETMYCAECDAVSNVVKDVEYLKVCEKLDGTTCDKCSLRLECCKTETSNTTFHQGDGICAGDSARTPVGKNPANFVRESINTSVKELALKFETEIIDNPNSDVKKIKDIHDSNIAVQTEVVQKVSNVRLHSVTADLHKKDYGILRNSQESVNYLVKSQESNMKNENIEIAGQEDITGKVLTSKNIPVYPLLRRPSLKGEQIFNHVDGKIEMFQKEYDSPENYGKVGVFSMDLNGCKDENEVLENFEKQSQVKPGDADIVYIKDGIEETRHLSVSEGGERNFSEVLDLSVKKKEQESVCDNNNSSNFSISFTIQINFDKNSVSGCKVSNIQTYKCFDDKLKHLDTVLTPDEIVNHSLTNSLTETCLKNVQEVLQNKNESTNVKDSNRTHIMQDNALTTPCGYIKDTKRLHRSNSDAKSIFHYQGLDNIITVTGGQKYDVYTFTDDESDDDVYYYASKLHVSSGNEDDSLGFNEDRFGQLNTFGANAVRNTMEDVFDAGGTDENNNREKEKDNKCTDRKCDGGDYSDNRSSNKNEEGNERGRGEEHGNRDDDDKENNDENNNNGNNTDKIQNIELLPCLVCQAIFNSKTELFRHLTKIHRLTNMCQICYFEEGEIRRFANPVSLRNHKVRDHPEDMVKCVCGAMLIDNKMLSSHLKKFKCNAYEPGGESNEMAKCICGKRFSSQEMLLNHRSKCRKRHCFDETCEIMDTSSVGKKRCTKTTSVENFGKSESDSMILGPKLKHTDVNNNVSQSETKDISLERSSKVRKCKENENEKAYDKLFKTAINLSKMSRRKSHGELEQTRQYERLPSTQMLSKCSLPSTDGVLDLRTKSARDRNVNAWIENVPVQPDTDINYTVQGTSSALYIEESKSNNSDNLSCQISDRFSKSDKLNEDELNETAVLVSSGNKYRLASQCTKTKTQPGKMLRKIPKSSGENKQKCRGKGKFKAKKAADVKYPCKICRRQYKKPYLYTHQKIVHARKQWVLGPATSSQRMSDNSVKYRCNWCRFVCLHWATGVRHHYMTHQQKELNLITLASLPKVSLE